MSNLAAPWLGAEEGVSMTIAAGTIEPRPAFFVLARLGPTAATPAGDYVWRT